MSYKEVVLTRCLYPFYRDAGDGGDNPTIDREAIAAELGVPAELAELATGESEESIREQLTLAAAVLEHAQKNNEPPAGKKPPARAGNMPQFDSDKFGKLLDSMIGRFGEEQVHTYLKTRLGDDGVAERLAALELREARIKLADAYGLTPDEAAALPGATPEQLAAAAKYAATLIERHKSDGAGDAKLAGPLLKNRTLGGSLRSNKKMTLDEALAAFQHDRTAADDIRLNRPGG